MTDLRIAAQTALEALEAFTDPEGNRPEDTGEWRNAMRALEGLRAAMLAAPARQPLTVAWQPIETAPKTGRKIIVHYMNSSGKARRVMARWLTDEQAAETDRDGGGLEGGWYECIDNWDDYTEVAIYKGEPTHWMPLPEVPGGIGAEQKATSTAIARAGGET